MHRIATALFALFLLSPSACAERPENTEDSAAQAGFWERVQDWWTDSQKSLESLWQKSQDQTEIAWRDTRRYLTPRTRDQFAQLWEETLPTLEEALALEERQKTLPESSWFGDDQESNRAAINRLLDQAVAVLSTSNVQQYRDQIAQLQRAIAQARRDIAEYRQRRISAPRESLIEKTAADYEKAIEARQRDIAQYEQHLEEIKQTFAEELRGLGLSIRDDQVDLLLSTVVGDNLIDLGIVFSNVKAITAQLEKLTEESGEDLQSARRYYGMYVILLKSLHQMHLQVEQAIAGKYLPQIDAIADQAQQLMERTKALWEQAAPAQRRILSANLRAQRLTLKAAALYRQYLNEQGRQVTAARVALESDIATAWNTYETVRISGELVHLVRSSQHLLDGLLKRQVPALRPFRNLEMQREFEKLTARLRENEE